MSATHAAHDLASYDSWVDWDACVPVSGPTQDAAQPYAAPPLPSDPVSHEVIIDDEASFNGRRDDPEQAERLRLLQYAEWDKEKDYRDEHPPTCIRYRVEWSLIWKGALRSKVLSTNTEQDVVLRPDSFWNDFLSPKLRAACDKKLPSGKDGYLDDIEIVVSVNQSKEDDLPIRFDEVESAWPAVEAQILEWGDLFRSGKKIKVIIRFNYKERVAAAGEAARSTSVGSGRPSATRRQLAERGFHLNAVEASTGRQAIWNHVYTITRCTCENSMHCWRSSTYNKHYPLKAHHIRGIIKYVADGGVFTNHEQMPEVIQDQLLAEENQEHARVARRAAAASSTHSGNVMHMHPSNASASSLTSAAPSSTPRRRLKIFGSRDKALKDFCEWQETKVDDPDHKAEYQKAYAKVSAHMLDLESLYEDDDPDFLSHEGLKRGPAKHMIRDIPEWVLRHKRGRFLE